MERKEEENSDKTFILKLINVLQIIACIIISILFFYNEEVIKGVITLIITFILFAFINGFTDIIELLDSINKKIK